QDPRSPSSARHRRPPPRTTNRRGYVTPIPTSKNTVLLKEPFSILETLGAVWSRHGATSVWKGTNATFIYSVLFPTLNTYLRGLLSAILALPDETVSSLAEPDLLLSSSASGTTLVLTCIASALSAIILSPIDTTRTYLMLTQGSHGPRTLIRAIKKLPSPYYLIPSHLLPITLLTSTLPNLIAGSAPLFFRNYLSLDPLTNQSAWSIFAFISSGLELAVRFPLETVLRRAQIATYTSPALRRQDHSPPARPTNLAATGSVRSGRASAVSTTQPVETVVPTPQSYRGVVGTMWSIVYEEGTSAVPRTIPVRDLRDSLDDRHSDTRSERSMRTQQRRRRGQGIQGLYRGWRLGMWSIVGVWGSGFLGAILGSDSEGMVSNSGGRF
ncbi:mitochondrial fusion and transport protein ugo1, partial [Ascosphaera atra]